MVGGIPILRTDHREVSVTPVGGNGGFSPETVLAAKGLYSLFSKLIGTNFEPYAPKLSLLLPPGRGLVLGSGAGRRKLLGAINLDYFLFSNVDIVADALSLPFEDDSFDFIVSEFVIEHISKPEKFCGEASRVLKSGGILYISYPFIHPYHAYPNDYFRYTPQALEVLFPECRPLRHAPLSGPACRWVGATADLFCGFLPYKKIQISIRVLLLLLLFPIRYLDLIYNRLPQAMGHSVTLYSLLMKR
ncbi:MAG: class I SAM-dependent methyltransferase [Planctomycetes bacterium]|nr:class I SAM-dependent methyltransferase [Planctomycetota bacterium]